MKESEREANLVEIVDWTAIGVNLCWRWGVSSEIAAKHSNLCALGIFTFAGEHVVECLEFVCLTHERSYIRYTVVGDSCAISLSRLPLGKEHTSTEYIWPERGTKYRISASTLPGDTQHFGIAKAVCHAVLCRTDCVIDVHRSALTDEQVAIAPTAPSGATIVHVENRKAPRRPNLFLPVERGRAGAGWTAVHSDNNRRFGAGGRLVRGVAGRIIESAQKLEYDND